MKTEISDPADIVAVIISLNDTARELSKSGNADISEAYQGVDQFMRETIRVAEQFEQWACSHVLFDDFGEVFPYFIEDKFGKALHELYGITCLRDINSDAFPKIAEHLHIPFKP
jgi:hypothetical protein